MLGSVADELGNRRGRGACPRPFTLQAGMEHRFRLGIVIDDQGLGHGFTLNFIHSRVFPAAVPRSTPGVWTLLDDALNKAHI